MTRVARKADGLTPQQLLAAFPATFLVIFLRRPDALLRARFYTEDGKWVADAYNYGWWRALFQPYQGYIHLFSRLVGAFALAFGLLRAPLIENILAITLQTLPVCILLSPRSRVWGSLRFRIALSALYLVLPNAQEVVGCITESQWVLALCALLLLVGSTPESKAEQLFDVSLFVLCSLTGPFCIMLVPVAVVLCVFCRNDSWRKTAATIFCIGSIVQGIVLLIHGSSRSHVPLGPSPKGLLNILTGEIFVGTLLGPNSLFDVISITYLVFIMLVGLAVILMSLRSVEMRCLAAFSALLLIATLINPLIVGAFPPAITGWMILARAQGSHYWFLPCLTFAWAIAFCIKDSRPILQVSGACLLSLMFVGLLRDFRCPPRADLRFESYARQFDEAKPGSKIAIPINPEGWSVSLQKH